MNTQTNTKLIAIVAMNPQRIIGRPEGGLPWRISEDQKHFKRTTMGHPMIVGRKTFAEFGNPLPGRIHLVVTRNNLRYHDPAHVRFLHSVSTAHQMANKIAIHEKVFVIGGATIYDLSLGLVDEILVTRIQIDLPDGPKFPKFEDVFDLTEVKPQTEDYELEYQFERWVSPRHH